jgi:hypothetical protein
MTDDELVEKWKRVLDYSDEFISPLLEEDRLKCARELEETENEKWGYIYKVNFVPQIRKKYSGIPIIVENIDGQDYLVTEVTVTECLGEQPIGETPKWKSVDKRVKWYLPILEDKSDESYSWTQNIHAFGRGYTDGIYDYTPKYGSSNVSSITPR